MARWEQAAEGLEQMVLLSGEAGIGKSRLVQALRERMGHGEYTRIEFRCSSYYQNSAWYPVLEHLQRFLQFRRDEAPEAKLEKLEQRLRTYHFAQPEVLPLLATLLSLPHPEPYPPLHLSPERHKQRTQEALVAWLVEEAERQPVLAVWEDLHWADPSNLEFVGLCIEQVPTARLFLLLTCRPVFRLPWSSRSYLTHLTLGHLRRPQVAQMDVHLTGGKTLPAAVLDHMLTKTDGVPLFVEEMTKAVLESGLLQSERTATRSWGPCPRWLFLLPCTMPSSRASIG